MDCQPPSHAEPHQQVNPEFTSDGDLSDDGIDALADFLLLLVRESQPQPLRDAEPSEPQTRSTEAAS